AVATSPAAAGRSGSKAEVGRATHSATTWRASATSTSPYSPTKTATSAASRPRLDASLDRPAQKLRRLWLGAGPGSGRASASAAALLPAAPPSFPDTGRYSRAGD